MTIETALPGLVGTLASLPEHTQAAIRAYGAACARTTLQSPEVQRLRRDSELLNAIETECWDVRFGSSPNGDAGDSNITIEIVGHFMGKPLERVIGESYNERLRPALEQAMTADAYPPARPEYENDES